MYPLTPSKVYVLERVTQDPACMARMERILEGLGNRPPVVQITEGNLPEVVEELSTFGRPTLSGSTASDPARRALLCAH